MSSSPLAQLKDPTLLKTDALINGQWVAGTSRFDVHDPATGAKLADVANLGPAEAEAAIAAANAAWPAWKAKTAKERSILLRKWYDLLMANQDDLDGHGHGGSANGFGGVCWFGCAALGALVGEDPTQLDGLAFRRDGRCVAAGG
jgi:hypothetical protein